MVQAQQEYKLLFSKEWHGKCVEVYRVWQGADAERSEEIANKLGGRLTRYPWITSFLAQNRDEVKMIDAITKERNTALCNSWFWLENKNGINLSRKHAAGRDGKLHLVKEQADPETVFWVKPGPYQLHIKILHQINHGRRFDLCGDEVPSGRAAPVVVIVKDIDKFGALPKAAPTEDLPETQQKPIPIRNDNASQAAHVQEDPTADARTVVLLKKKLEAWYMEQQRSLNLLRSDAYDAGEPKKVTVAQLVKDIVEGLNQLIKSIESVGSKK
jgi:hypothetical protein